MRLSPHFKQRAAKRRFSILDAEEVIRYGKPVGSAVYCPKYQNYKYRFSGSVDGLRLRIVFAIDATQDYAAAPLLIFITGAWHTKSGARQW